jgi:predicted molibdopterin-dependent oxidoreductase YjgC
VVAGSLGRGPWFRTHRAFGSQSPTNEVNFAAQKFSRTVLASNNIDSCNRT